MQAVEEVVGEAEETETDVVDAVDVAVEAVSRRGPHIRIPQVVSPAAIPSNRRSRCLHRRSFPISTSNSSLTSHASHLKHKRSRHHPFHHWHQISSTSIFSNRPSSGQQLNHINNNMAKCIKPVHSMAGINIRKVSNKDNLTPPGGTQIKLVRHKSRRNWSNSEEARDNKAGLFCITLSVLKVTCKKSKMKQQSKNISNESLLSSTTSASQLSSSHILVESNCLRVLFSCFSVLFVLFVLLRSYLSQLLGE